MSKASITTYYDNLDVLETTKGKTFRMIKDNPGITIHEIVAMAQIKEVTVGGRISDLLDDGYIKVVGTRKIGDSTFSEYEVSDHLEIERLKKSRKEKKFWTKWRSLKDYIDVMPDSIKLHFV